MMLYADIDEIIDGTEKPLTNAEWIRSMSDKGLAEFFGHSSLCNRIQLRSTWCDNHAVCTDCLEEWLQQPAEVEHD
jgi:hypothetical protein